MNMEVQARLPAGIEGTLDVAWYSYNPATETIRGWPVAVGEKVSIPTPADSGVFLTFHDYCVVVTTTYLDGDDQEQTASVVSAPIRFTVIRPPSSLIGTIVAFIFGGGIFVGIMVIAITAPLFWWFPGYMAVAYPFVYFIAFVQSLINR